MSHHSHDHHDPHGHHDKAHAPSGDAPVSPIDLTGASAALPEVDAADIAAQLENVRAENDALKAQITGLADQALRAQADAQNTRRRAEEDIAKSRKFAVEAFAESLLPVLDSLEAALAAQDVTAAQLREGSEATLRQLLAALERHKVVAVAPEAGSRFDPAQQQAISMVPADQEANTVVGVLQKGYLIAERVLRPALVTVAAPK